MNQSFDRAGYVPRPGFGTRPVQSGGQDRESPDQRREGNCGYTFRCPAPIGYADSGTSAAYHHETPSWIVTLLFGARPLRPLMPSHQSHQKPSE
jgi:hypothetical protein